MSIFTRLFTALCCTFFLSGVSVAQTSWKGTSNTQWSNAANWTNGVPTAAKDAILGDANFTGANQPTVDKASSCKSLTIGGAATTTLLANKNLTVSGNLLINSNGTITQGSSSLTVTGNWTNNNIYTYSNNNAHVIFSGVTQAINGSSVTTFRKLTVNTGSTLTLQVNLNTDNIFTVNGTVNPNNAPTYLVNANSISLNSGGKLLVYASVFSGNYSVNPTVNSGSAIEYASATINQTVSSTITYSTLQISGATTKSLPANLPNLLSTSASQGNIHVKSGTFDLQGFTANRGTSTTGGNFEVDNGAILKIGGTNGFPANYNSRVLQLSSTVHYYGNNQTVSALTYGNLVLSSSTGTAIKTLPATPFTIEGSLTSLLGTGTSVSYTAAAAITVNGDVNIGASTTFSGASFNHSFSGNWINNGIFTGGTSTVNITGSGSTISGTGAFNINNLTVSVSGITAAATSSLSVSGNLVTTGAGEFTHVNGGTLTMTGTSKMITGSGIIFSNLTVNGSVTSTSNLLITGNLSVSGSFSESAGTITMSGATKTISGIGTIGFFGLAIPGTITASCTFTVSSFLDVSGSFTAITGTAFFSGSTVLNGTANLNNVTISGISLTLSGNSVLGIAGSFIISSGSLITTTNGTNTVNFNGSVAQNVNAIVYNHLTVSNGSTKTTPAAITVNGNLTIGTGTTLALSASSHQVFGNWINNGTLNAGTSTVQFRGTANKYISGANTFNVLTISKASSTNTVTLNSNTTAATVTMTLGTLLTGANSITITNTRTGNGIILGTIIRTHAFSTGTAYEFEGPDNRITFSAVTGVTSVTVQVSLGSIGDFPDGAAINRVYNISVPAGTYTATLRLHYEDAELNGNNESTMLLWRFNGAAWVSSGKSGNSTTSNYVEQVGLTNITNRWSCADASGVVRWNGSVSTAWENASNWSVVSGAPSLPPGIADIAQIGTAAFTNQPMINTAVSIKSLSFGSAQAAALTLATGGSLSTAGNIGGSWTADAVHIINTANQTLSVNGDLGLSNGTAGRVINLNIGAGTVTVGGTLIQSGGANVNFSSSGALVIGSNYQYTSGTFTAGTGTVSYTGSGPQTVAPVTYNHLTINKTTGIASVNNMFTVGGNLSVLAGELNVNANMTVTGNVTINPAAILDADGVTLSVAGNWNNSGNFVAGTGEVICNGTGNQTISATNFNNLVVNKTAGTALLSGNCQVNSNLSVLAGTLDLATFSCNRVAIGGIMTVSNGAFLQVGGAANFPANFTLNNLGTSSSVNYNGSGTQSVAGVTYGNLNFSNGGANAKTLLAAVTVAGNLLINSGATAASGGFTINLSGNWNNNGTFLPSTGTVILNGATKTVTGSTTFNRVTVNGSYTVTGSDIVYNGLLNVAPTGSYDAGSGTATVNGDLTNRGVLISSGTTTFTGLASQTLRLINAISSTSTGIVNFNGTVSPVMNSTSSPTFATVNINNTGGVNPSISWYVYVAMNINSGATFNGGVSTHYFYGNFTNAGTTTSDGTFRFIPAGAATVNFGSSGFSSNGILALGGTGLISIAGTPTVLKDVLIENTNAAGITPSSNWTMSGKFSISSNAIFNASSYTFTVGTDIESDGTLNGGTSTFIMNGVGGTLTGSPTTLFNHFTVGTAADIAANSDFSVMGNYTNDGTYDGTMGNLIMTGSNAATIGGTPVSNALSQLIIAKTGGAMVTMAVGITDMFILYVQSGILFTSTYGITQDVSGGFMIIDNGATLRLGGTNSLPAFSGYSLDANSNVDYAGTTQSIGNAAIYGNLLITAAGNKNAIVPFTTQGNFTLTNGNFTSAITVTHSIGGNWLMTGGTFTNTNITIQLNGSGNQTISSTGAFKNLVINKSAGLALLASNNTVTNVLTMTLGRISLLGYNLTLPTTATISGFDASRYIIADSTGVLTMQVAASGNKVFPVGTTANYTPATIALTAGSVTDNFSARVKPYVLTKSTSGLLITDFAVNNTWFITEQTAGGSDATVTLQWPAAIEQASFTRIQARVCQSSGAAWNFGPISSAVGSNPYTSNRANVTTFSAFAVMNDMVVLGVTWLQAQGESRNRDNIISWKVANEKPGSSFVVEYSANAVQYSAVGQVTGTLNTGSVNAYTFTHTNVTGAYSYYRIRHIDADRSYSYSPVIRINSSTATDLSVSISPNPVVNDVNVYINADIRSIADVRIVDYNGKVVLSRKINLVQGQNITRVPGANLSAGIYVMELDLVNGYKQTVRFIKQ